MKGKADSSTTPQNAGMVQGLVWVVNSFALECIWLVTDECCVWGLSSKLNTELIHAEKMWPSEVVPYTALC